MTKGLQTSEVLKGRRLLRFVQWIVNAMEMRVAMHEKHRARKRADLALESRDKVDEAGVGLELELTRYH